MNEEMKSQFQLLSDQIRRGFESNDRQFRILKSRMAKLELELSAVRNATNTNTVELAGIKHS